MARWAKLRRATFPWLFAPEICTGILLPLVTGIGAAVALDAPVAAVAGSLLIAWYGPEVLLARYAGWHTSWRAPLLYLMRDCMLPAIWVSAWCNSQFYWRGNDMRVGAATGPQHGFEGAGYPSPLEGAAATRSPVR